MSNINEEEKVKEITKEEKNGIRQFAVASIPWTINWEALEITEEEDKHKFIKKFIENIKHKPIISYDPENPDIANEKPIGVVEDAFIKSNDTIDLFCSMWMMVSPEYNLITTNENMKEPLGLRLEPNSICIQFDKKLNDVYTKASQMQEAFATKIREVLDPEFANQIKEESDINE